MMHFKRYCDFGGHAKYIQTEHAEVMHICSLFEIWQNQEYTVLSFLKNIFLFCVVVAN